MYKKIGLMVEPFITKYGEKEALKIAKECGADCVDFSLVESLYDCTTPGNIYSKSDEEIIEYFSDIKKYADDIGIEICQTHGRLVGYYDDENHNEIWRKNIRLDCMVTKTLGAPVCVIHAMNTFRNGVDCPPEKMHKMNTEMFCFGLQFAKQYDIMLATETFGDCRQYKVCDFFGQTDEFIKQIEEISKIGDNDKYFGVCIDTGHSNKATRYGQVSAQEVIRRVGKKTKVLHLNDNDTFTDQHKMPFSGTIDWDEVFDALDEVGYDGVYNLELELAFYGEELVIETASFAVKVLRNYLDKRYN